MQTNLTFSGKSKKAQGFALIVTIVLVAFIVLILVGLATFTRVETQVAENTETLARARQNAVQALNIALGELQRTAGPDQRITASGDLLAGTHASNARWTGVWDATNAASTPTWLVSGITAANANETATPAVDGVNVVRLVGNNSTDTSVPGNEVAARTVQIEADAPGIGNTTVGRFAWWVGDEGVKARADLVDPWASTNAASTRINSWTLAQRAGVENVRVDSANPATRLGADFPVNSAEVERLLQLNQIPFLNTGSTNMGAVARARFHDLSTASRSVLADVANGGLRKDLSAWLRGSSVASGAPADTDLIFTPQSMGVASPAASDNFGIPRWGLVRDFNNLRYGTAPIEPRLATDTRQGISPMLSLARVGFAIEAREGQPLRLHMFPSAVLWNPYSVPLAPGLYEFGIFHRNSQVRFEFESTVDGSTWTGGLGELWLARGNFPLPGSAADDHRPFVFRIRVTEPIPPGESWVFSVPEANDGDTYTGENVLLRGNFPQHTLVIEGTVPVPAGTTEVRWGPGGSIVPTGGEVDAALRPAFDPPSDAPSGWPAFQGLDLRSSAYLSVQRMGHDNTMTYPAPQPVDVGPLPPAQPRFGMAIWAKMGSTNFVNGRWIATANYRAQLAIRTAAEPNNPTFQLSIGSTGSSVNLSFLTFDGDRASAGRRVNQDIPARNVVLAEILPSDVPLASLAQLQHANLARLSMYPGNAVGNSHASYRMDGDQIQRGLTPGAQQLTSQKSRVYDFSYGLNRALWDRFYFSTIPDGITAAQIADAGYHLPNARLRFFRGADSLPPADLLAPDAFHRAAGQLLVEGGFNVNSTSVEAWRALLSSANGLAYNPQTRSVGSALSNPISRFSVPVGGVANASGPEVWTGYRTLTDAQINQLAQNIVAEVRARGPFRSLAEFINRRPLSSSDANYMHAVKGALQAAIDATTTGAGAVNSAAVAPFNDMSANSTPTTGETAFFRPDLIRGNTSTSNVAPFSSTMAFAPGMVSQADLLNAIGPVISARSDTFVIRTYGETINPATGERVAVAFCEAIVQRLPDYVDAADAPEVTPPTNADNLRFGRRFVVVGFRWLTPQDI